MVNSVYKPLFTQHPRYFILMGGRGAGRSTVASQFANAKLIGSEYFRCAIMRYVFGDIRNSIFREITDRADENDVLDHLEVNDTTMSLTYGQNSINAVGFKKSSGDQKAKLKSLANYNCVIIEEADEIPEEDFMQLDDSLRTMRGDITIILLLNPPAKTHWIIRRWFDLLPSGIKDFYIPKLKEDAKNTFYLRTNYKDNIKNLAPQSVENYQNYEFTNPSHFYNMVLGYVPETVKGKIFSGWTKIQSVPKEAKLLRYGLDFGYSNDPTAIVAVYKWNDAIILKELLHRKKMFNSDIATFLKDCFTTYGKALVVADSAEPKSIDEIALHGIGIIGATKGAGSLNQGIQAVQRRTIFATEDSVNLWEEYENRSWKEDKDGKTINEPKPGYDHQLDAVMYPIVDLFPIDQNETAEPPKPKGQMLLDKLKAKKRLYKGLAMNTSTQTKTVVIGILRKDMAQFGIKESELTERIGVIWDTEHFNTKEDHSVWLQSKDKAPNVCEVYFDDVWMCDLYDDDTHTVFKVKFYRGFLKAYEKGTIRLNRAVMLAEQEAKEAAKKQAKKELEASIKALPEVTPEDKASKEIIKEMAKEEETNAQVSV